MRLARNILLDLAEVKRKDQCDYIKDLDQWLRKMKCTGVTGVSLSNFSDIKVGINTIEKVDITSTQIEPYPDWRTEEHTYKGYKDAKGNLKGKVIIELENGDTISGTYVRKIWETPFCTKYKGNFAEKNIWLFP